MNLNEEVDSFEIWAREPDGTEGRVAFLNAPEVYDDLAVAYSRACRYRDAEVGWDVPVEDRREWFIVTATTTRQVEVTINEDSHY